MKRHGWLIFCSMFLFFLTFESYSWGNEGAVELKFAPSDCVYVQHDWYNSFVRRPYYDIIIHTISVVNSSAKSFCIESIKIEAIKNDQIIQGRVLSRDEIQSVSKPLLEKFDKDLRPFLNLILWADKVVSPDVELSTDLDLKPNSALLVFNTFLSFSTLPDTLRISVNGREANGTGLKRVGYLKVVKYQNKVKYSFPLEGSWLMTGMPANGVLNHHRFGIPNEFGVDFRRVSPDGELFQNEGKEASDYYGFGEKVLAAADGIVVAINNSAVQKWTRFNPAEGESAKEFQERQFKEMKEALKGNIRNWVGGNYVIIKHTEGEYSSYFHMKENSVRVKVSDKVKRGQYIGDVGNTGDSFSVHLHFQVNNSPEFANGRSLPFSFENIQTQLREPGRFVKPVK